MCMDYGYVYCLRNDAFPGYLKIGYSMNVPKRMIALNTSVPQPFQVVCVKKVQNMSQCESALHSKLSAHRAPNGEFFRISIDEAKSAFETIEGAFIPPNILESVTNSDLRSVLPRPLESPEEANQTDATSDTNAREYVCARCGYKTDRRNDLKKHLSRPTVCSATLSDVDRQELIERLYTKKPKVYKCEMCHKEYASPQSKYMHKQRCRQKQEEAQRNSRKYEDLERDYNSLVQRMQGLVLQQSAPNNPPREVPVVNAFGREDLEDFRASEDYNKFMALCVENGYEGLCDYISKRYFDAHRLENKTIRKINKKSSFMECYDGEKWKLRFSEDVIRDVLKAVEEEYVLFFSSCTETVPMPPLGRFYREVCIPLGWEMSVSTLPSPSDTPSSSQNQGDRIYKLVEEFIYCHSK